MTRDDIVGTLKTNIGRRVLLTWTEGDSEILTPVSVDDEGFVYEPEPPESMYWNRLEEVASVRRADSGTTTGHELR